MSIVDTIKNMFGGAKDEAPSGDGLGGEPLKPAEDVPVGENDAPIIEPGDNPTSGAGEEKKSCDCGSCDCPGCGA